MKHTNIRQKVSLASAIWILLLIAGLALSGCNGSNTLKGSVTGRVVLVNDSGDPGQDPVDYSGITVAIYRPAVIDSTLVRLNQLHPNIGVIYDQNTYFDHRLLSPVAVVTSGPTGEFELKNIPIGKYNLVFTSEDWSLRYLTDLDIAEDKSTSIGDVELLRKQVLAGAITQDQVFKANKQYLITDNVSCIGNVTLEPNCLITPLAGKIIKFYGNVNMVSNFGEGDYWRYTSAYGLTGVAPVEIAPDKYAAGMMFYVQPLELSHGLVSYSDFGLSIECPTADLSDISCMNVTYGMFLSQCRLTASNLSLVKASSYGLSTQTVEDLITINRSLVVKCSDGISLSGGTFLVTNTYFQDNYAAFRPFENTGTVQNCNFALNYYDIYQYRSSCYVYYNDFYHCRRQSLQPRNFAQSNNNNYYKTDGYFIDVRGVSMAADLDAKNNYWGVSNIDQYLNDALDNDAFPDEPPCNRYVIYLPKRSVRIATAGIQP